MIMEPFKSGQMHIHKYIYIHTYIHTYICKAVQTNELMKDFYQQKMIMHGWFWKYCL